MAQKIQIIINADGTKAIKSMQEVGATARATGNATAEASRAAALAAKFEGDTISAQSVKIIGAKQKLRDISADYAKIQAATRKGAIDEATGITATAAAYQRLEAAKLKVMELQKVEVKSGLGAVVHERVSEHLGEFGITESMAGATAAIIGTVAVVAELGNKLREVVSDALEFGEAMERASKKTGLSVETLSVLHYAAAVTGGDFDGMTKAAAKLGTALGEAADGGNKKAAATFKALGLDVKDLANRTDGTEIAFKRVAEAMAATENPAQRLVLAKAVMSRAGAEEIATLMEVGSHWDEMKDKAQAAGVVLSGKTAAELEETNRKLKELGQAVEGAGLNFAQGFTPAFGAMLNVVAGGKGEMQALEDFGSVAARGLSGAAAAAYAFASGLARILEIQSLGTLTERGRGFAEHAESWDAKSQQMADIALGRQAKPKSGATVDNLMDAIREQNRQRDLSKLGFQGVDLSGQHGSAHKDAEEKFRAMKDALEQQKMLHGMAIADEQIYWQRLLASTKAGTDLYKLIVPEIVRAQQQMLGEFARASIKAAEESKRANDEIHASLEKTWTDLNKQDDEATKKQYATLTAMIGGSEDKQIQDLMASDQVREINMRNVQLPAGEAARETADMHTSEYEQRSAILAAQMTRASAAPGDSQADIEARARQVESIEKEIDALDRQRAVQQAEDDARIESTTLMGGMNDALRDFIVSATDAGAQMRQLFSGSINSTNDAILKYLTEPSSQTRGEHVFGQAGHEIFSNVAGTALKSAEGGILNMLGLGGGGKKDGSSETMALYVRMVQATGSGSAVKIPGMDSWGGDSSGSGGITGLLSKLFGGGQGSGSGGGDMMASDMAEATGGSTGGGVMSSIFSSVIGAMIPGFAGGVDNFGGGLALVGEKGPELVNLPPGASVTPNHKLASAMADNSAEQKKAAAAHQSIASLLRSGGQNSPEDLNAGMAVPEEPDMMRMMPILPQDHGPDIAHAMPAPALPNRVAAGGDNHYHDWGGIDARGANDPAAVEAAVQRGIAAAAPRIAAAGAQAVWEKRARQPLSAR